MFVLSDSFHLITDPVVCHFETTDTVTNTFHSAVTTAITFTPSFNQPPRNDRAAHVQVGGAGMERGEGSEWACVYATAELMRLRRG